jgi:tetratricopeptide (TPR) repeat protein
MARYQDVIDLATFAINGAIGEPGLEEAYFWRGQAEEALGQRDQAIEDYRTALVRHPDYQDALDALAALGVTP